MFGIEVGGWTCDGIQAAAAARDAMLELLPCGSAWDFWTPTDTPERYITIGHGKL
jgi:hypothetical protein